MITFKQFLETRKIENFSNLYNNNIDRILRHIDNPIITAKFALYCAEDCFHLNDEETRPLAKKCIDLVKKWLRDPESVTEEEFLDASMQITDISSINDSCACDAASSAAAAALFDVYFSVHYASCAFASSMYVTNTVNWRQTYNQKFQEYTRKLKGMTTTRSGPKTSIEPLKGYDNDYVTIMAALDSLEEIGEIGKDHFVYQDDEGQWVFDLGHDNILRADSREKLARLIHNDRYYLNALMRLYNANV